MIIPLLIAALLADDFIGLIEHSQPQLDLLAILLADVHHLHALPQHLVQVVLPPRRVALTHYLLDVSEVRTGLLLFEGVAQSVLQLFQLVSDLFGRFFPYYILLAHCKLLANISQQ